MTERAAGIGGGHQRPAGVAHHWSAAAPVRDQRPSLHLSAPSGWLNDPNGPIQWDGRYHLFFQHNPAAPVWAPAIQWGHAESDDLVAWRQVAPALMPSPGTADEAGCWSGCVVDDDGIPTAVYSGLSPVGSQAAENVCLARGDAGLRRWRKDERNPVLAGGPEGLALSAFRDPFVWREADRWQMLIGAGLDGAGAILAYESADLLAWSYHGILLSGAALDGRVAAGSVWECPQLLRFDGRDVLIVSVWDGAPSHAIAVVGRRSATGFDVHGVEPFDHGADCYAPAVMTDAAGRHLAWAWAWEGRAEAAALEQGWAGLMTFPRELTLDCDGRLGIAPAAELRALRGTGETIGPCRLGPAHPPISAVAPGAAFELSATVAADDDATVSLVICASPDGAEQTTIGWHPRDRRLTLDRSRSSRDPSARGGVHGGIVAAPAGRLGLRVFVDASIVEVYANDRFTLTERIHPTRADATGIALSAGPGDALLERLEVWPLRPSDPAAPRG